MAKRIDSDYSAESLIHSVESAEKLSRSKKFNLRHEEHRICFNTFNGDHIQLAKGYGHMVMVTAPGECLPAGIGMSAPCTLWRYWHSSKRP